MKIFWMILAGICIISAAVLMLLGALDAAFVVAALGIVAWFLNYRLQMKEITRAAENEREKGKEDLDED